MRLTEFWSRMEEHFGPTYAYSWAKDTVLKELGSRSVEQAIAAGIDTVDIWRAVWAYEGMPLKDR